MKDFLTGPPETLCHMPWGCLPRSWSSLCIWSGGKKAGLYLVHYRKLSKNYGFGLYVHSKWLIKSHLKSPHPLVPTLWLVVPVYLILILAQADANLRHGEKNVKEHLTHTFVIVHSWLTCKTHVFVLVQPLICIGKESAPSKSSWNTHSQKWHQAVNSGSSRPCQIGHKSQGLTGAYAGVLHAGCALVWSIR